MTTKQWTGQGGTNTAAITTANSGGASGDAFDAVTLAGSGSAVYSSTNPPLTGYMWERLQAAAGGSDRARTYHSFTATNQLSVRIAFRVRQDPGAGQLLFALVDTGFSFPVQLQLVTVSGARHLVLFSGITAGSQVKDWGTITYGSASTDVYWLDLTATKGTTTSNGTLKAKLYDETQTLVGTEYTTTSGNTGTLQFIRAQGGGNTGVLMDLDISAIKANDTAPGAYVGLPTVANTLPTVAWDTPTPDPFEPGTVVITGHADDTDGTISSITPSVLSGPNSPTLTASTTGIGTAHATISVSFTANESAGYVIRLTCLDNAGGAPTAPADVTVETYATVGDVQPYAEVSATSWTLTGAASGLAAVTDGSDASYRETPAAPSAVVIRHQWRPFRVGRNIVPKPKLIRDPVGGAAVTCVAKLYQSDGTTLVETLASFAVPTTATVIPLTFTAASLTTVASRRGLITELSFTQ